MKTIDVKKYVCDVCGMKHESKAGCLACENSHKVSRVKLSVEICSGNAAVNVTEVKKLKPSFFSVSQRTSIAKMSPKKVLVEWECDAPQDKVDEGRRRVIEAGQKWFSDRVSRTLALAVKKEEATVKPEAPKRRAGRPRKTQQ